MGETTAAASSADLMVDLIISLDGYASAEGWPGWWGLEGPEYLAWLEQEGEKDYTFLLGANTYRLMSGMSEEAAAGGLRVLRERGGQPDRPCRRAEGRFLLHPAGAPDLAELEAGHR